MPARAIDTASLSFGLVAIPVRIYSTSEPSHELHFHLIHEGCGKRLKQQYVCPEHGVVERSDMSKGFEITKGNLVELDPAELKALDAVANDAIELAEFVPADQVDPIFIDRSYYLGPDKGGDRAFRLLRDSLEAAEIVGIATYAARGKQYVVMVRPYESGMVMHQLRYPDEIKPWSEVPIGTLPKPAPSELGLAAKVIDQLRAQTFDPKDYKDEVKGRVRKLIASKAKGGEIVAPEHAPAPDIGDLLDALKASLGGGESKAAKPAKAKSHPKRTKRSPRVRAHGGRATGTSGRRHGARTRSHARKP